MPMQNSPPTLCAMVLSLVLAGIAAASPARAMSVSPIHIEMTSVGQTGHSQVIVTNTSNTPLPIDTAMKRLELDENGNTKTVPAGDEFLVFPPQAMIPPGGTQVLRIQWVGEPNLAQSQSYMLTVTQIPVKLPKTQSGVQVVMSFGIIVNVAPPQGQSNLKLVSTGIAIDKAGKRHPTITVEDSSNVHAVLQSAVLHLSAGAWSRTYQPGEIAQSIGIGLVQPGKRRKFVLPDVLPADAGTVQASLEVPRGQ